MYFVCIFQPLSSNLIYYLCGVAPQYISEFSKGMMIDCDRRASPSSCTPVINGVFSLFDVP